jgi:hypothetical protein
MSNRTTKLRGKKEQVGYYVALQTALERDQLGIALEELLSMSYTELKRVTEREEEYLLMTDRGEQAIASAKRSATRAYYFIMRG